MTDKVTLAGKSLHRSLNGMLSGILAVAMILTMLPVMSYTAFAADDTPLTFTAEKADSSVTLNYKSGENVMVKLVGDEWTDYTMGTKITLAKVNDTVSFRGDTVTTDYNNHYTMTGMIAASGGVTSLTNGVGGDAALSSSCYAFMFSGCTSLTKAPVLPATSCYGFVPRLH